MTSGDLDVGIEYFSLEAREEASGARAIIASPF